MGAETAVTLGMSAISGISLFATTILIGYISNEFGYSFLLLMWIAMPIVAFAVASAINTLTQKVSCPNINVKKVFGNSGFNSVFVLAFLALAWFSGVRSPIEGVLTFIQDPITRETVAYGYYMFWAGLFGEAIGAGLAQGC